MAMSSIQGVQAGSAAAQAAAAVRQQAAQPPARPVHEAASQESRESTAVTQAQAGVGDQAALQKVARAQSANGSQKGQNVDVLA
jgi:uncharacterized lipoprotein YmbA